eukprot:2620-Heterococcus_DN1.PRE.2
MRVKLLLAAACWWSLEVNAFQLAMTAAHKARRASNAPGNLFVDESCIDCDTCRWMAPETYQRVDHASVVSKQPSTQDELRSAYRAMVSCPTGSIRLERPDPMIKEVLADFPLAVDEQRLPGVYHLGFHSKDSYGGTPWLIAREQGGVMVDSPRYSSKLAAAITTMLGGAPAYMLLTHELSCDHIAASLSAASHQRPHAADDIADHAKWAAAFPTMKRIMHTGDIGKYRSVKPGVIEIELSDSNADRYIACYNGDKRAVWELAPDLLVIHTPGHTEGCVSLFFDSSSNSSSSSSGSTSSSSTSSSSSSSTSSSSSNSSESGSTAAASSKGEGVLFTGDHLAYSHSRSALTGFPGYNRAGLLRQADSIAVLAGSNSSSDSKSDAPNWLWVLPGHGRLTSFSSAAERSAAVRAAADALRADAQRSGRH